MLKSLTGDSSLNTEKIASFMQSPTVIDTKNVYPMNSYGSGMAPLMTNLALWVGALLILALGGLGITLILLKKQNKL